MTIRNELKEKFQHFKSNRIKENHEYEPEARKMIEEFIIPQFRKIASENQYYDYLDILIHEKNGCWTFCNSQIPYGENAILLAVLLADEYDIYAKYDNDQILGQMVHFTLSLR